MRTRLICAMTAVAAILAACGGGGSGSGSSGSPAASSSSSSSSSASVVSDWTTYQGDSFHTGYVPVTLDPAKFQQAWTWTNPSAGNVMNAVHAVVTGQGRVYVTNDDWMGNQLLYALDAQTGSVVWNKDFGTIDSQSAPAYSNGHLYVEAIDRSAHYLFTDIDAASGTALKIYSVAAQAFPASQPVIYNNVMLANAGNNNVWPNAFSTAVSPFSLLWYATPSNNAISGIETPALDATYAYNYTGTSLDVFKVSDGSLAYTIADPNMTGSYSTGQYNAAPILGSRSNILAYAGPNDSATATAATEGRTAGRVISSFDLTGKKVTWTSAGSYYTTPALAGGILYLARNTPSAQLDALSETDGHVLWSWTPPSGETFHRNTVVTRNLVFVSTDVNVYAIDLTTHAKVWSLAAPGTISVGPDASGVNRLYIVKSAYSSAGSAQVATGTVVSVKLQ